MELHLKDKRALVTGASRGLGYATAKGLAQEGAHVAINSRSEDKIKAAAKILAEETGQTIHPLTGSDCGLRQLFRTESQVRLRSGL